jgi:hypothetical protein
VSTNMLTRSKNRNVFVKLVHDKNIRSNIQESSVKIVCKCQTKEDCKFNNCEKNCELVNRTLKSQKKNQKRHYYEKKF